MTSILSIDRKSVKFKTLIAALAVVASVALPQIFHLAGGAAGLGNSLGTAFLPMHLTVILAGLIGGPVAGLVTGALSPVLSLALSGMPSAAMLPFMTVELAAYGLSAGLIAEVKLPTIVKLLIVQLAGRAVRACAVLLAVYAFDNAAVGVASIWNGVVAGLPGIMLQWAIIPLMIYRVNSLEKKND